MLAEPSCVLALVIVKAVRIVLPKGVHEPSFVVEVSLELLRTFPLVFVLLAAMGGLLLASHNAVILDFGNTFVIDLLAIVHNFQQQEPSLLGQFVPVEPGLILNRAFARSINASS